MNPSLIVKFLISILLTLNVNADVLSEALPTTFEELMNFTANECQVKENATHEDVAAATTLVGDWPQTREGKCFIDCFLEEVGIVRVVNFSSSVFSTFFFQV